jgi:hypothetical protein
MLSSIPYFTRSEEMDRVGFEPITSDHEELSSISNKLQALLRLKKKEKSRKKQ